MTSIGAKLGAMTGYVSGGLTFTSGVMGSSQQDSINTYVGTCFMKSPKVNIDYRSLQKEFADNAKISEALGKAYEAIDDSFDTLARDILENRHLREDSPLGYHDLKRTAGTTKWNDIQNFLQQGAFVKAPDSLDYDNFSATFGKIFRSIIVSATYLQDQVFIAKIAKSINGVNPCTVDLCNMNEARICIDDTAYI